MRKIIAINQVTLDGIMQAPGGPEEDSNGRFAEGGWAMPYWDDTLGEVMAHIMSGAFDLLLGRRTYEVFAGYWPHAGQDNPIARGFNSATKFVVTNSLETFDWANSRPIGGNVVHALRRLRAAEGPELHMWGSHRLLQTLIAQELVDEFRVLVYPVVLGMGKRLFEPGVPSRGLALVESRSTPKGVVFSTYRPAGPIPRQ